MKYAVPILWRFLKLKGCSDDVEREELMRSFVQLFLQKSIRYVYAAREFASHKCLKFLINEKSPSLHTRVVTSSSFVLSIKNKKDDLLSQIVFFVFNN